MEETTPETDGTSSRYPRRKRTQAAQPMTVEDTKDIFSCSDNDSDWVEEDESDEEEETSSTDEDAEPEPKKPTPPPPKKAKRR